MCRSLLVSTIFTIHAAPTPILRAGYGQGNDPIVLDDLRCNGRENRLIDYPKRTIGTHNCIQYMMPQTKHWATTNTILYYAARVYFYPARMRKG